MLCIINFTNQDAFFKDSTSPTSFESSTYGKQHSIKGHIDCNTSNVIYQFKCKISPKDYTGKSIPLRININNHKFHIVHQNSERLLSSHAIHHSKN